MKYLSNSGMNRYAACPMKAYLYSTKAEIDSDSDPDTLPLQIGKTFHDVLEKTLHDRSKFKMSILSKAAEENGPDLELRDIDLIYVYLMGYYELHEKSGLRVVKVELKIETEDFLGYLDVILVDPQGFWYIADMKVLATVSPQLVAALHRDQQLNLYASKIGQILHALPELKFGHFAGVMYRVVQKSKANRKETETLEEFDNRLRVKMGSRKVKFYQLLVKPEGLDVKYFKSLHKHYYKRASEMMLTKPENPLRNYKSCYDYFRPCEYWSRCHSKNFTECQANFTTIYTQDSIEPINVDWLATSKTPSKLKQAKTRKRNAEDLL